jgi:hypothetical protein
LKATDFVLGSALVCARRPAPGATGSALGCGGGGGRVGVGEGAVVGFSVTDGVGETLGVALLVVLTGRALVPAPAFPLQAAQTARSSTAAAAAPTMAVASADRRVRTPVSRHFTRDEVYSERPGRHVKARCRPAAGHGLKSLSDRRRHFSSDSPSQLLAPTACSWQANGAIG